ncbi:MAG: 5'-deoxyadenosine deaminase [Ignavibacteriaceae bacterium]
MKKKIIIPKRIVTVDRQGRVLSGHFVVVEDDRIISIEETDESKLKNIDAEIYRFDNLTLIPGLVQNHIHLCQSLFRGFADDLELLEWLQHRIFPFENAHNPESLRASVRIGLNELIRSGTTTILDMGTLRHQHVVFEELALSGIRAFGGKCLIDINELYPAFKSDTDYELKESYELAAAFHNIGSDNIKYAFSPRFVLSCSEKLLKDSFEMMKDFPGSLYHTHASENKKELEQVKKRFGMRNIEYLENENLLNGHTVLAHCIHTDEKEINALKNNNVGVAHCPSANLKLGSGIADIPRYLKEGIRVGIGADGAPCNNSLNPFIEMRLSGLIQKPMHGADSMDAEQIFRMATIDGAATLNIDNITGSIEPGKKADLVLIDLENSLKPIDIDEENIYSAIVYSANRDDVVFVMADGQWLVENSVSNVFDEYEIYYHGKEEFSKLMSRI